MTRIKKLRGLRLHDFLRSARSAFPLNPPAQPGQANRSAAASGDASIAALALLQKSDLFGRLGTASLAALAEKSRFVEYARKESIVAPAERPQGIYLVESGLVKLVFYSYRGHEKSIALLGAGKAFGQAECFSGKPMHCHALCLLPARVLLLGKAAVRSMAETNAQFGLCIIDCLSRQYDALVRDIKYTSGYGASQRIVSFLL
ncbi:MAG: Crp/Fnr family transcriptional regulator, partial [Wenzhouxiangellaceae bacterium]|nr:Crp/Fnr family transcriptional regulator [Wenzhouxiangellaceae bacterium]